MRETFERGWKVSSVRRRNRKKSQKVAKEATGDRAHTNPGESAHTQLARLPQSGMTGNRENMRLLQSIEPEGIKAIGSNHEWEMVDLAVDSGATETGERANAGECGNQGRAGEQTRS